MRRVRPLIASLAITLLIPGWSFAWHGKGHKVVALIAFRQLEENPGMRTKVIELLRNHEAFTDDVAGNWKSRIDPAAGEEISLFMLASVFADDARRPGPFHGRDDPDTHFVNIPFIPTHADRRDPAVRVKNPFDGKNIARAFRDHVHEIISLSVAKREKALHLSWIFHLVGDIHQPLHSTALYTQEFKNGDRGGNGIRFVDPLKTQTHQDNLHAFWDGLPGEEETFDAIDAKAKDLMIKHPRSEFANASEAFEEWTTDSFALARKFVYNGLTQTTSPINQLPAGYADAAQGVADRQVALAGYRLAEVLRDLFGD